jgi:hypothetical protein
MIDRDNLKNCLELLSSVSYKKPSVTEFMIDFYYDSIERMDSNFFDEAIKYFYEEEKFPTVQDILQFSPEKANLINDWFLIMSVVNGTQKSAVISGISASCLATVTSTNSSLGAMRWLIDASEFQISQTRKDWERLTSIPPNPKSLPPAEVTITFEAPAIKVNGEDRDSNFIHRTAAMIRCIKDKGAISAAWVPIIDNYPAEKRKKIYDFAVANNFTVLGETKSLFHKRSISTAQAMLSIDEQHINQQIAEIRHNHSVAIAV